MQLRALILSALFALACGGEVEEPISTAPVREGPPPSLDDWIAAADPREHPEAPTPAREGEEPPETGIGDEEVSGVRRVAGTVRETMASGGYSYMRVETEDGEVWVAAMQTEVSEGDHVEAAGTTMRGFRSGTLNRVFDELLLAANVRVGDEPAPRRPSAHGGPHEVITRAERERAAEATPRSHPPMPQGHPPMPQGHPPMPQGHPPMPQGHPPMPSE